jgi:hypothetical protein
MHVGILVDKQEVSDTGAGELAGYSTGPVPGATIALC